MIIVINTAKYEIQVCMVCIPTDNKFYFWHEQSKITAA